MHTIGIISEYNPFHSGHRYQLEEVRKAFGPDCAIVCAMSDAMHASIYCAALYTGMISDTLGIIKIRVYRF